MAKIKKNGTYLNICVETPIYEKQETLCVDVGQTKTKAVERALRAYFDDCARTQKIIKAIDIENKGVVVGEEQYGK